MDAKPESKIELAWSNQRCRRCRKPVYLHTDHCPPCGSYDLETLDLDVPADCWAAEYRSKGPSPYMLLADGRLVLKQSQP